jgi:RNA recognition motif-containing protein
LKLYVGNLCHSVTEAELTTLFSCYGAVKCARIVKDHHTRQSKNFGYIEMPSAQEGRKALAGMDGHAVNNRRLVVREARPRDQRLGSGW